MDIQQRRAGFRLNSVRGLLRYTVPEFARLLNRSHYTILAIERCLRYPTEELILQIITLAAQRNLTLTDGWLLGEENATSPLTSDPTLQSRIHSETHIEHCLVHADNPVYRQSFGQRLTLLLNNMNLSIPQFASWSQVSVGTVKQWLLGNSLPKKEPLRFIANKFIQEKLPLSLAWFCTGQGELVPFKYIQQPTTDKNDHIIHVRIDTAAFDPYITRHTKISAYPFDVRLFISNWEWGYLYLHEGQWLPVQMEGTTELGVFHIMSRHSKLSERIFLQHVRCDFIYPILYLEKTFPTKIHDVPLQIITLV